jgi:hypothetical protein
LVKVQDSPQDVFDLAASQRWMMLAYGVLVGANMVGMQVLPQVRPVVEYAVIQYSVFVGHLLMNAVIAYFVFRIARIIYGPVHAAVASVAAFIPCLGTLTIISLTGTTMDRLRKSGVKSNLYGVERNEIERLRLLAAQAAPLPNSDAN